MLLAVALTLSLSVSRWLTRWNKDEGSVQDVIWENCSRIPRTALKALESFLDRKKHGVLPGRGC